jgi:hypothetical protein
LEKIARVIAKTTADLQYIAAEVFGGLPKQLFEPRCVRGRERNITSEMLVPIPFLRFHNLRL